MNFTSGANEAELLSLDRIRGQLIRLEDTIIFCPHPHFPQGCSWADILALIERAQFAYNQKIYQPGAFESVAGWKGTWLEWFLYETECFHGRSYKLFWTTALIFNSKGEEIHQVRQVGFFRCDTHNGCSPDEYPFTPLEKLPKPILAGLDYPSLLHIPAATHPSVNVNTRILDFYVGKIVPRITLSSEGLEDDGNYGSAATRDVEVLQALSRRIHYGLRSETPPASF